MGGFAGKRAGGLAGDPSPIPLQETCLFQVRRVACRLATIISLMIAAGCATTPREGVDAPAGDSQPVDPSLRGSSNYAFEIEAPTALAGEIRRSTLVGRWQRREDYDPIQFSGLVARLEEEVQAILRSQGYFQGKVTVQTSEARVRVAVEPGSRAMISALAVRMTGPGRDDPAFAFESGATALPELAPGQPFETSRWEGAKRRIIDELHRYGYLRAAIASSEARVDVQKGAAALDLVIASGPRLAFGELDISGLQRYDRRIIEDVRPFTPGEPFSEAKLVEFQSRLRSSGYFSSISALPDLLALQENPDATRVDIQVIVSELQRRRLVFGLGYSTDEGPRGQVGLEHRDLFGTNLKMESALVLSAKRHTAFANFRTPFDRDNRFIGFGQRIERDDIEEQITLRSNTYVGQGRRYGDIESFTSLQYQIEREEIPAGANGPAERNVQRALVLGYSWNLRRLDSIVDPTRGYAISAQISGAHGGLLSDRTFLRLHTRATRIQPLPKETAFEAGTVVGMLELGIVNASSREDIPSENLFRTGGVQSVRGYSYQSLGVPKGGAIVGGRYLAVGSLEYQHRITAQYAAAVFADYGNAADSSSDLDPVAGYGVGLRLRTPVGPVNLDVAYGQEVSRYRIHFSVGYTF